MAVPSPEKTQAVQDLIEQLKSGARLRSKDTYQKWKVAKLMAEARLLGYELHTTRMIPKKRPRNWRQHSAETYVIYTYRGDK